jgi:hypothetical protein
MANVYYSYPSNRRGTLRAVLSPEQVRVMLKEHSTRCAGKQFPMTAHTTNDDFAILQVFEVEASKEYAAGFYLFDEAIMQIEEELRLAHA